MLLLVILQEEFVLEYVFLDLLVLLFEFFVQFYEDLITAFQSDIEFVLEFFDIFYPLYSIGW